MKKFSVILSVVIISILSSCSKDNAKSYKGTYDVELVGPLGQIEDGSILTITEKSGDLAFDLVIDDETISFTAVDNGDDYFEVEKCNLCWDTQTSIIGGKVSKVDKKIAITLQLLLEDDDEDDDFDFSFEMGIGINEI
tara:strand:+ start:203 stop:616 length:414 start_codon:yes stop_codon:yes gene_type:complete